MVYDRIVRRISELENIKTDMNGIVSEQRIELATKEAEVREIREMINKNIFENTAEYKELEDLKVSKRIFDIYSSRKEDAE